MNDYTNAEPLIVTLHDEIDGIFPPEAIGFNYPYHCLTMLAGKYLVGVNADYDKSNYKEYYYLRKQPIYGILTTEEPQVIIETLLGLFKEDLRQFHFKEEILRFIYKKESECDLKFERVKPDSFNLERDALIRNMTKEGLLIYNKVKIPIKGL